MSWKIKCENGHEFPVAPQLAGTSVRCPVCRVRVVVPKQPAPEPNESGLPQIDVGTGNRPVKDKSGRRKVAAEPGSKSRENQQSAAKPKSSGKKPDAKNPTSPESTRDASRSSSVSPSAKPAAQQEPKAKPAAQQKVANSQNHAPKVEAAARDVESAKPQAAATQLPGDVRGSESDGLQPEEVAPSAQGKAAAARESGPAGIVHNSERLMAAYLLALGVVILAVVSIYPAVLEIVKHMQDEDSLGVQDWVFIQLGLGIIQLAYGVYLVQLPDWTTTWVTSLTQAALATLYAVGLGVTTRASQSHELILALDLGGFMETGQLLRWCLLMLLLYGTMTYIAARMAYLWHKNEYKDLGGEL